VELMAPDKGKSEESTFSEAEKLRRERARMMHTGVTSFKWAGAESNGHTLLVPLDGALWVLDHANGEVVFLLEPQRSMLSAAFTVIVDHVT